MYKNTYEVLEVFNHTSTCLVFDDTPMDCLEVQHYSPEKIMCSQVKVIICNDIHLSTNPMYLYVAELFISEKLQLCVYWKFYFSN